MCAKWCLFGKLKVDSPDGEEKTFDLYLCVVSSEIVCGQASYLHSLQNVFVNLWRISRSFLNCASFTALRNICD